MFSKVVLATAAALAFGAAGFTDAKAESPFWPVESGLFQPNNLASRMGGTDNTGIHAPLAGAKTGAAANSSKTGASARGSGRGAAAHESHRGEAQRGAGRGTNRR
jgi:hypothetical protein